MFVPDYDESTSAASQAPGVSTFTHVLQYGVVSQLSELDDS